MFEHSVRVPRHYKVAANIFKKVSTEGGSVKTLLYDNKLRHFRTNVLFALITETVKHAADIDKIFESCEILKKESRLDPWLAKILTAELLFGKKSLPGISKPEQTVLAYKEQFEKYTNEHEAELKTEVIPRPRYVRINTNLLTTSDAIRYFQDEGYKFIRCTSGSYDDYLKQIQGLTEYDFTQDYHVKTIFVFPHGTKLHEHDLYLENQIILQDKATALAVHLLAPPTGSVVLDMCAAPGMKTTQVAAYMRNEGKIYAVERNEKRFQTLTDLVNKTGCKCVELLHKDSLEIRRGEYDDVEYILLDPSCSGSGMEFSMHKYIEDARLAKLTSLQEKFLKHAMNAFPKAKRIVYSTCSLFPEENERVITNVVKNSRSRWRVQDVKEMLKGQWNNVGSSMYGSMGTRCLYARPDSDLTTGFFLAVLDRDPADIEKAINFDSKTNDENNSDNKEEKKEKRKKNKENSVNNGTEADDNTESSNKKEKSKVMLETNEDEKVARKSEENYISNEKKSKKDCAIYIAEPEENESENLTKKKKYKLNIEINRDNMHTDVKESTERSSGKKKKRQKDSDVNILESEESKLFLTEEELVKEKKNKKRKRDTKTSTVETNMQDEQLDKDIEDNALQVVKKEKKKHKSKEITEFVNVECNQNEPTDKELDISEKKKKKKKRKASGDHNDITSELESNTNNDAESNELNQCNGNDFDLLSKKKKKKRDKSKQND